MAATFNDIGTERSAWCGELSFLLRLFSQWLKDNGLLETGIAARIARLEHQVRFEKVTVAFVAEYSRGKSELINALLFADYGLRILPARAGRTTMCPTEIGYQPGTAPCLRLLPIQTRLDPQSLLDWRTVPDAWVGSELDVTDSEQLASTLDRVTETIQVSTDEAKALGFFQSQTPPISDQLGAQGLVKIPKWRHALVNIAHPLLAQGLVIVDTPGFNAIGAEPELTHGLIAQAHAVVFVLGADTAVTQSNLVIWEQHIPKNAHGVPRPLVVLNKLDALWETFSSPAQVPRKIDLQIANVSQKLRLKPDQILAVSAKSALIAKVNNKTELLTKSCIADLEAALVNGVLGQGNHLLAAAVSSSLTQLQLDLGRAIQIRRSVIDETLTGLRGMQSTSTALLIQMRHQLADERQHFELGCAKFSALIAVQSKMFRAVFSAFEERAIRQEVQALNAVLAQPGLKLGAKNAYSQAFENLRRRISTVQALVEEIQAMHSSAFEQFNAQFKFSLGPVTPPSLEPHRSELNLTQIHHAQYLGLRNALRLQQPLFVERLSKELYARLMRLREELCTDMVAWRNSLAGEVEAQLASRRVALEHRRNTVEKIEHATAGIGQRAEQIALRKQELEKLAQKLDEQASCLIATNDDGRVRDVSMLA